MCKNEPLAETDNSYEKIIAEYKTSLSKINRKIKELKARPNPDKQQLSQYFKMRYEHSQAIKAMSKYVMPKQEEPHGIC